MADNRYFIVSKDSTGKRDVYLSVAESHHLSSVSRIKNDEIVTLLDGRGGIYNARVKRADARKTLVEIIDSRIAESLFRPDIAVPLIRANRMDIAVEKCAELGVRRIIPYISERTIWRGRKQDAEKKVERLERKIIAACKQSGQPYFPQVEPIIYFNELLETFTGYKRIYLADSGGECEIENDKNSGEVLGIVGPEGGLTEDEKSMILKRGAIPVSLGVSRLRSETASICLVFYMRVLFV
jgi:16S rRNA (uracil1498-N3)-methyltransferase